jgi:hypothetical protein
VTHPTALPARMKVLLSYYYYSSTDLDKEFTKLFRIQPEVFFDSGGFSAFTQGIKIKAEDYGNFLLKWQHVAAVYANLDVIGSPEGTWANQQALEAMGLHPIPVFHVGEPWSWLERYVERYPYIALGGMVPHLKTWRKLLPWLVRCFQIGRGKSVYHGFGVTTWSIVKDFPWYSIDSSSWGMGARYGVVPLFDPMTGKWSDLKVGDNASCRKAQPFLARLGLSPQDFADRKRYHHTRAAAVSAASYFQAEQWLQRRHGPIMIPERETQDHGLKLYLADARPRVNDSYLKAAEDLMVGTRMYLADANLDILAAGSQGLKIYLVAERPGAGKMSQAAEAVAAISTGGTLNV